MEEKLKGILWVQEYDEKPEELLIYEREFQQLLRIEGRSQRQLPHVIALRGRAGSGRRFLLGHLAYAVQKRLVYVYMDALYQCCVEEGAQAAGFLKQMLAGWNAFLCLMDRKTEEDGRQEKWKELLSLLVTEGISCYVVTEGKLPILDEGYYSQAEIRLREPDLTERTRLWEYFLGCYGASREIEADVLGGKYRLNAGDINHVLVSAALYRDGAGRQELKEEDIRHAVFACQEENLGAHATKIPAVYTWEDLVMEERAKKKLREICDQVKYRSLVGGRWGFYDRKAYGKGISALFYGPAGTGKTMAAQIIANELGLALYRVDLSRMMSKYIGETQKNISSLFERASYMNIILLFDEADAFFSRRTSVKDSHDRHANGEVAHLLQQMEDYDGIVILTTNLKDNMDDAFRRRIKMMIEFQLPEEEERLKLWEKAFPKAAPRAADLRLSLFARRFEISGSEIQETVLQAAFQAAADGGVIENRHIEAALRDCYLKYGKLLLEEEFRE